MLACRRCLKTPRTRKKGKWHQAAALSSLWLNSQQMCCDTFQRKLLVFNSVFDRFLKWTAADEVFKFRESVWAGGERFKESEAEMHEWRWQHVFCMLSASDWLRKNDKDLSYLGFIVWIVFFIGLLFTFLSITNKSVKPSGGIDLTWKMKRDKLVSSPHRPLPLPPHHTVKSKQKTYIKPLESNQQTTHFRQCAICHSRHRRRLQ